jgi:hypothetical protein
MPIEQTQTLPPPGEASPVADEKQDAKAEMKGVTATPTNEPEPGDTAPAETDDPSEADKPKKKGGGFQNRIDRLTRRAAEAEREAAELRQQIQGKPPVKAETQDPEPTRPKESDFSDWSKFEEAKEDYITDRAAWKARQEVRTSVAKAQEQFQHESVANQRREAVKRFEKQASDLASTHEGLDEAVERFFSDKSMPVSQTMAEFIMEHSERGPEIVLALDADLDEAERISKLSPIAAARELARLEAKLPKPEARKVSNAPAPTKVVKGTAESPIKKLEDMSNAEYMAWARERDKKAGKLKQNIQR